MKKIFGLFSLIILFYSASAQHNDEELAAQYYADGEYEKAVYVYKKLHKKNPSSIYIYDNYLNCLIKLKSFSDAEKIVQKRIRKEKINNGYKVDLGYLYTLSDRDKDAEKLFTDIIKSVNAMHVTNLAGAFRKRKLDNYAIKTYEHGRKKKGLDAVYGPELLGIYKSIGASKKLIGECLNQIRWENMKLAEIKQFLIPLVDQNKDISYLQEKTLLYIQKNPEIVNFDKLLLWVFTQQKKFRGAYRQAVAMDKRNWKDGSQLISLAELCVSNKAYDIAIKSYNYVIGLGSSQPNFVEAKMGLLETSYTKLREGFVAKDEELAKLINEYKSFINLYGKSWNTAPTIKELADIYIYYKHDLDEGIALLEEISKIPRLQPKMKGSFKLTLGDAYLMKNELWDATLIYGQVDKEFKEDPLGQEAKFRNAQLSYFKGDFDWSKNQLDVLKTATTQLISNNAIELVLRIQDNTGLDSNTDALKDFAQAELLLKQNKLEEALKALNLLPFKYPKHALEDEIYFIKATIFRKQGNYTAAIGFYESIYEMFPDDILADNALYELAKMYEIELGKPADAMKMFEKIVLEYTGSLYHVDARKAYHRLKKSLGDTP